MTDDTKIRKALRKLTCDSAKGEGGVLIPYGTYLETIRILEGILEKRWNEKWSDTVSGRD